MWHCCASDCHETTTACCRDEAVKEAEAAEQRAREAQAATAQARGQQARQSALSEELRQAVSQSQQLASQLKDVSAQSIQVRARPRCSVMFQSSRCRETCFLGKNTSCGPASRCLSI